jgi:TatD DNase family protein
LIQLSQALADTHCHLDLQQFDADRDAVVDRALEVGVTRIMNPGIDLESSRRAVALAGQYSQVYAAVGFHPHDASKATEGALAELRQLALNQKVKAIGEIGLDYYRDLSPREQQRQVFGQQLDLAGDLNLPVIIHSRDAHQDVLAMLAAWVGRFPNARGVLHSFSGDRAQLVEALELGFVIGITGPVTFPKADELRAVAQVAPLERILIETDAPYLSPAPRRGRRNEPAYVWHVAEKIAQVRGMAFEGVARQTSANATRLFEWSDTL